MESKYKKLALTMLDEDSNDKEIDKAILNIAQNILDFHLDRNEKEFNSILMPPEYVLPNETESYQKIEKLVQRALDNNISKIEKVL